MSDRYSLAFVLNGPTADIINFKRELENSAISKGIKVIFVKSSNKRLFIIEDDYSNGGQA
jgi:hypothetical protein